MEKTVEYHANQWRMQDFQNGGGGVANLKGNANLLFRENCMKIKEIGPRVGANHC